MARKVPEARPRMRPALTPEARENQLIALAVDRAEQQLRDGTASSQVITHYLKLATARERLERDLLEQEVALKRAKTELLQAEKQHGEMYKRAIAAFREYSGYGGDDCDEDSDVY